MDQKDEIKKETEEISPFLAGLKKENPFKVPANYFEQLPDQIMEQVRWTSVERKPVKVSWLDRLIASFAFLFRPQVVFSALCLVAATWAAIYIMKSAEDGLELANDQFIEAADSYIAANIDEFDAEWLGALAMNDNDPDADVSNEKMITDDIEMDDELMDEILDELEDVDLEELL